MKQLLFACAIFLCVNSFAQQTDYVDFKRAQSLLLFNQIEVDSTLFNSYEIEFEILKQTDSIYLDAIDMKFDNMSLDNASVAYKNDGKKLIVYNDFEAFNSYKLKFLFFASPKKAMYFVGWDNEARNQIWTQGQGKYTSHWLPSIDDMNEKIEFDLTFAMPNGYEVISNGKMVSKTYSTNYNLWEYDMLNPMSSYLVAVAIGKYSKKVETSKSGVPLEMYYYPEDSNRVEPTYRYSKRMFDFLENEIGVAYPWQNYKQVPVHDFLYAGMENTGTTIFADTFVVDSIAFNDRNYVNVNAHELAHQWFGDLVTAKSGTHHWLQEGFATYYALLAERDIFGDNYYYRKLYESAQQLYQQDLSGNGTSLLNPDSSSLTFYQRGAWVLHILKEKVGEKVFKEAVKTYLQKYQFKNVETNDFISEVELYSEKDLSSFVKTWIETKDFPYNEALTSLKQSVYIQEYLMVDCEALNSRCDYYLNSTISDEAKIKIISQVPDRINSEVFRNSIKVRQAIAENLTDIPLSLKKDYESLLQDKSYKTVESALYNLWLNFPEDRSKYLSQTKDIQVFNDYNVRLLWLALHLNTLEYQTDKKDDIYNELVNYTSPEYNVEVRMNAYKYLEVMKSCDDVCNENLLQARTHHNWRMVKFAKGMLKMQKK